MILQTLLEKYKQLIRDNSLLPNSFHILWMCDEISDRREAFDISNYFKINRWLGFIQGYLYSNKLRTIDELRNETRGIDDELIGELCN